MIWNLSAQNNKPITNKEELVDVMLHNRGLTTKSKVNKFLFPNLSDFEKELQLEGIPIAEKRITKSIKDQELIYIYGDYDVDGVCSTAIMYKTLTARGAKVLPYIPHREKEGYGLSETGIRAIADKGAKLIITVDNGIVALEQSLLCQKLGIDLIITDHHMPSENLPQAHAIVHSTKMCGSAVAWCLARSLLEVEAANKLLDLVAMATICDLMPLTEINRAFAKEGIEKLHQTENLGLKALSLEAGLFLQDINSYHIGHILGPRLNAIGRLEHAMDALRLLCTASPIQARNLAQKLCAANDQKKKITTEAINLARQMLSSHLKDGKLDKKIILLKSPDWIPGVIGLMAGRIVDEYQIPTIVIAQGEVYSKGSARSIDGVNIIETIRACSDCLLDVGGHTHAAGFTLETAKIDEFDDKISSLMENTQVIFSEKVLELEGSVNSKKVTLDWVRELQKFEPFGLDNPKPAFEIKNINVSDTRSVGSGQHLKFKADGVDAIAFGIDKMGVSIKDGDKVDLAVELDINSYRGKEELQFKVLDIHLA